MVHHPPARLDALFGALADPTRRAVLAQLRTGDQSVGELAGPSGMSLPGFMKHLRILEDARLIDRHKQGRVVTCRLRAEALRDARDWLERYEEFWSTRLDRLGALLERKEKQPWSSPPKSKPASASVAPSTRRSAPSTPRGRTRKK